MKRISARGPRSIVAQGGFESLSTEETLNTLIAGGSSANGPRCGKRAGSERADGAAARAIRRRALGLPQRQIGDSGAVR